MYLLKENQIENQTETCVHRKETSTNFYINWNSHTHTHQWNGKLEH